VTSAGSFEAEISRLAQKLAENPTSRLFAPLADAYRRAGRIGEAIEVCRLGLEHHPDYLSGLLVLARCHHDAGDADAAEATFRRVVERDPNNVVAQRALGEIAHARGEDEEAIARYRRAIELQPGDAELRERLDSLVAARQAVAPAVAQPQPAAVEEVAGEEIATLTLAEVYAERGLHERALAIYRRILVDDPANQLARERIERLERELAPPPVAREAALPGEMRVTGDEVVAAGPLEAASPALAAAGPLPSGAQEGFPEVASRPAVPPWAFLLEDEPDRDPDEVFATRGTGATAAPGAGPPGDAGPPSEAEAAPAATSLAEDDLKKFQEWLRSLR
jgi:tetratricopeptide (TPR) repeat protein